MISATIKIDDSDLVKVLQAEDNLQKDRSTALIKDNTITIKAKDIIAFKATINGFIKVIETYENVSNMVKNGK
ncbi:MAG: hypothetical protein ACMXYG_01055 [Candidatus Woesearchaeota archaeon]